MTLAPIPSTIANLPAATTPLSGTELVPISQGGVTKSVASAGFSVVGPTGPQGATGATGATGPQGPAGGAANISNGTTNQLAVYTSTTQLGGTNAIPNGTTATTQSPGDNSTKVATTAYVNAAGGGTVTTTGSPSSGNLSKFSGATSVTNADLTGDVTTSGTVATTLATVNSNIGTFASVTVNGKGLVTAAANLTGDITSSSAATTLATVNSNVGSFTAANITVNAKGLITAASNGSGLPAATAGTLSGASTVFTVDFTTYSAYMFTATNVQNNSGTGGASTISVSSDGGSTYIASVLFYDSSSGEGRTIGFISQPVTSRETVGVSFYGNPSTPATSVVASATTAAINRIKFTESQGGSFNSGDVTLQPIAKR